MIKVPRLLQACMRRWLRYSSVTPYGTLLWLSVWHDVVRPQSHPSKISDFWGIYIRACPHEAQYSTAPHFSTLWQHLALPIGVGLSTWYQKFNLMPMGEREQVLLDGVLTSGMEPILVMCHAAVPQAHRPKNAGYHGANPGHTRDCDLCTRL